MIDDSYLTFFITEDLYLVKEPVLEKSAPAAPVAVSKPAAPAIPVIAAPAPPAATVHDLAIWAPALSPADRELLTNILKAIKKDFSKAFLMEGTDSYKPHYRDLICFGYARELSSKLGSAVSVYQPVKLSEKRILLSVTPAELHADKKQKALLWEALQKMFL